MRLFALPLLLLPIGAACASSGTLPPVDTTAVAVTSETDQSDRNLITAVELETVVDLTTLNAIRRLRPNWLRSRAAPTPAAFRQGGVEPALLMDGILQEGLEQLETLPVRDVRELRFLSASEATTLYGTGYTNGVILVRTR